MVYMTPSATSGVTGSVVFTGGMEKMDRKTAQKRVQAVGGKTPAGVSAEYSQLLGSDLSGVRLHTSGPASDAAAGPGFQTTVSGKPVASTPKARAGSRTSRSPGATQ